MIHFSTLKRSPIKRHAPKRQPGEVDREYVAWIKTLPCAVPNCSPTPRRDWDIVEAHHAGAHGFAQRASDRTCIPLCAFHHRIGQTAAHVLGKHFWVHHNLDRDALIRELNKRYDTTH